MKVDQRHENKQKLLLKFAVPLQGLCQDGIFGTKIW